MEQNNTSINFISKEFDKHDCYIAEFIVDNHIHAPNRTFFPSHWTEEQVMNKINEACDNFNKSNKRAILNHKGKYTIRGFTNEGIEIEIILTKDAEMETAYPLIK